MLVNTRTLASVLKRPPFLETPVPMHERTVNVATFLPDAYSEVSSRAGVLDVLRLACDIMSKSCEILILLLYMSIPSDGTAASAAVQAENSDAIDVDL